MPLTAKGKKILRNMQGEYGAKKGKSVFYASINKGKLHGVEGDKRASADHAAMLKQAYVAGFILQCLRILE